MKTILFCKVIPAAVLIVILNGCSEDQPGGNKAVIDSIRRADSIAANHTLENLLQFNNEADLAAHYGKESVQYDTIWGAEGFFTMGTILKTEPQSHIEITWQDEAKKQGIVSVTLVSDQDWYADSITSGEWTSSTGITLGMPVSALQKVNGAPFTFSGFGWDYAGHVINWQKGKLEGSGIAVQLSEGPVSDGLTAEESAELLGDVELWSDDPLVQEFHPRVWSVSVAR